MRIKERENILKLVTRYKYKQQNKRNLIFLGFLEKKKKIAQKIKKGNRHRNYNQIAIINIEQIEDGLSTCIAVEK